MNAGGSGRFLSPSLSPMAVLVDDDGMEKVASSALFGHSVTQDLSRRSTFGGVVGGRDWDWVWPEATSVEGGGAGSSRFEAAKDGNVPGGRVVGWAPPMTHLVLGCSPPTIYFV